MKNENSQNEDVLEAIGVFSNKVEKRFDKVEGRLTKMEANMVTRDLLDEKLNDLKADLTVLMRKEDRKLETLIEILRNKQVLSEEESKIVLSMEPFPRY